MRKFRVLLLLLVFIGSLLGSLSLNVKAVTFTDVPEKAWYKGHLVSMADKNIINGYGNGKFGPEDKLTKAQYITMLVRLLGELPDKVEGPWWQGYVDKAYDLQLLTSTADGQDMEVYITRGEMAKYTERVLTKRGEVIQPDLFIEKKIKDYNLQDEKEAILKCYAAGIITGYPDGTFKGYKELTRAEALVVLDRILNKDIRKPVVNEPTQKKYADAVAEGRASNNVEWVNGEAIITSMYGESNPTYLEPGSISTDQIPNVHEIIWAIQEYYLENSDYVVMTQHQKGVYEDTLDRTDVSICMANSVQQYLRGANKVEIQIYDRGYRSPQYEANHDEFSQKASIVIEVNYQAKDNKLYCFNNVLSKDVVDYLNEDVISLLDKPYKSEMLRSKKIEGYQIDYIRTEVSVLVYVTLAED